VIHIRLDQARVVRYRFVSICGIKRKTKSRKLWLSTVSMHCLSQEDMLEVCVVPLEFRIIEAVRQR
jgi:hypothetical protein